MAAGRPRQFHADIPAHIDQRALPVGVRWCDRAGGYWRYTETLTNGRRTSCKIAAGDALLSELHAAVEQRTGGTVRGTLVYISDAFVRSQTWRDLSPGTREDYTLHAKIACDMPTKLGVPFGTLHVDRLSTVHVQKLVDMIAEGDQGTPGRPSTANHVLRYLRRLLQWGVQRGLCKTNPARGVLQAKERKKNTMPDRDAFAVVLAFARQRGALPMRSKGSIPPYIAPMMDLAFLCRMRRGEVIRLTEADATDAGILVRRLKGSRDNVVAWTPELRAAWLAAIDARSRILTAGVTIPRAVPPHRPLFVGAGGRNLSTGAVNQAMQTVMAAAVEAGVIGPDDRFSLHGLKHRGVTDTAGNRADKQTASGHRSQHMLDVYDHELPIVAPARPIA